MSSLDAFATLVEGLDYPMFVVTAAAEGERSGCLVGFVTQSSIDPPRLLVMVSKANHTFRVAAAATTLGVHFLGEHNHDLAEVFGEVTGDVADKFAACDWEPAADGTPILRGTRGWVLGTVRARLDCGDHVAHLIDVTDAGVTEAETPDAGRQLGFQAVRDLDPGHPA